MKARMWSGENLEREGLQKHVTMAAGLISVERQAVGGAVAALVKWNTTRQSFTHQFSQFALLQSWWRQEKRAWLMISEMFEEKTPTSAGLRRLTAQAYGSCTRPPPQDSRRRHRSAVGRAGSCRSNSGTVQSGSHPAGGWSRGPGRDKTLRLTCRRSPARRHTSNSLERTESSTCTGTGPHRRSEAGE